MIPAPGSRHGSTKSSTASTWLKTFKRAKLNRRLSDASDNGGFNARRGATRTANTALIRRLKGRHLQMIAIGGSIGQEATFVVISSWFYQAILTSVLL